MRAIASTSLFWLSVLSIVLLLAACGPRAPLGLDPPPADLLADCPAPLSLPLRDVTQAEVERLWGSDRARLRACRDRHRALADWAQGVTQGR